MLTAIRRIGQKRRESLWLCKCDCGKETTVLVDSLQRGNTKSCGCLQREISSKLFSKKYIGENNPNYIYGMVCGKHTKAIRELKERIRKRDNYTCQECSKAQEENLKETDQILDVHHIDGNDMNNIEENMVAYCRTCHSKLHEKLKRLSKELKGGG